MQPERRDVKPGLLDAEPHVPGSMRLAGVWLHALFAAGHRDRDACECYTLKNARSDCSALARSISSERIAMTLAVAASRSASASLS
jgi:hypothetical protein